MYIASKLTKDKQKKMGISCLLITTIPEQVQNIKQTCCHLIPIYWVPLRALVPCHFFFPFLVHRFVVWTVVALSDGNNLPRSSSLMCGDVDQNHVRFHVAARCFRIQKLHLYTLDKNSRQESLSILSSDTVSNILNTIQKPAK